MCSLIIECVLLLQNLFSYYTQRLIHASHVRHSKALSIILRFHSVHAAAHLSLSLSLSLSLIVAVLLQGFSAATQKEKDKEEREIQIADRLANQMDDLNPLLAQLI